MKAEEIFYKASAYDDVASLMGHTMKQEEMAQSGLENDSTIVNEPESRKRTRRRIEREFQ